MKVTLINYTPDALETLIFTKNTRLAMSPELFLEIMNWPREKKMAELAYMKGTIQSSWEFIDYIFMISGVSRAFTHQLVRHRVGTSFAQQAQRVVNLEGFEYITGPSIQEDDQVHEYDQIMAMISSGYNDLVQLGVARQDARGVIPTNVSTNIVFKANLRTLHDMGLKRLCVKAQGEFQDVFREIRARVIEVHPWTEDMIRVQCAMNGTCIFPSYPMEDCPVKPHVFDPQTGRAYDGGLPWKPNDIQDLWEVRRAEAQPLAPEAG